MMDISPANAPLEGGLEAALAESRADLAAGRVVQESPEEHLARLAILYSHPPILCKAATN
jgi:hypothetical protein